MQVGSHCKPKQFFKPLSFVASLLLSASVISPPIDVALFSSCLSSVFLILSAISLVGTKLISEQLFYLFSSKFLLEKIEPSVKPKR